MGGGWWECEKKRKKRKDISGKEIRLKAIFQQNYGSQNTKEDVFKIPKGKTVNLELYIKQEILSKKINNKQNLK